jgi:ABC-type amino acid transport system permease subunit
MDPYPWIVIAHVFFVIIAFGAHGVSAFASFRVKASSDRAELKTLLDLSQTSLVAAGVALLVAILLGIWAAIMGGHFSRTWPWAAIVVLVVVVITMTPLAANPMRELRAALGIGTDKSGAPLVPGSDAAIAAANAKLRPELTMVVGIVGLAVLVWLMELKPF